MKQLIEYIDNLQEIDENMSDSINKIVRALLPNKSMLKDLRDFNGLNIEELELIMHKVFSALVKVGDYIYQTKDEEAIETYTEMIRGLAKLTHKINQYIRLINKISAKI